MHSSWLNVSGVGQSEQKEQKEQVNDANKVGEGLLTGVCFVFSNL